MTFSTKMAAFLSGATVSQLNNWAHSSILLPELGTHPRRYSFRDVVALRALAVLRSNVSLQKIRRALATMEYQNFTEHISEYRFATDGTSVKVWTDDGFMDLVANPGQFEFKSLADIYAPFTNFRGRHVPGLLEPAEGIEVRPERLGGSPTVAGTRVPLEMVMELTEGPDGLDADEIGEMYPSVSPQDVRNVISFNAAVEALGMAA